MRQIEKKMVAAFRAGKNFRETNTEVIANPFGLSVVQVRLYDTIIAERNTETGEIKYSCGGWWTTTTRSRLAALGAPVQIKNYEMIRTDTGETFPNTLTTF